MYLPQIFFYEHRYHIVTGDKYSYSMKSIEKNYVPLPKQFSATELPYNDILDIKKSKLAKYMKKRFLNQNRF